MPPHHLTSLYILALELILESIRYNTYIRAIDIPNLSNTTILVYADDTAFTL
jgi:hypothetical protein